MPFKTQAEAAEPAPARTGKPAPNPQNRGMGWPIATPSPLFSIFCGEPQQNEEFVTQYALQVKEKRTLPNRNL
jgi:hypothetical protein